MTVRDTMLGARVPLDLRRDYEELARRRDLADLSPLIRTALRDYVDRELGRIAAPAPGLFDARPGHARPSDPSTSRAAATLVRPRSGSQRRRALELIAGAGDDGLTTDEVIAYLELEARRQDHSPPAVNGIARRVTDLAQAGAIRTRTRLEDDGHAGERVDVTRLTRHGAPALVYTATELGLAWLREPARKAA